MKETLTHGHVLDVLTRKKVLSISHKESKRIRYILTPDMRYGETRMYTEGKFFLVGTFLNLTLKMGKKFRILKFHVSEFYVN